MPNVAERTYRLGVNGLQSVRLTMNYSSVVMHVVLRRLMYQAKAAVFTNLLQLQLN
jgi:hypothetical protein